MVKISFDIPDLYDVEEAANLLHISYPTIYRWIKAGKLIPLKANRRTLIPKSEIERLKRGFPVTPSLK